MERAARLKNFDRSADYLDRTIGEGQKAAMQSDLHTAGSHLRPAGELGEEAALWFLQAAAADYVSKRTLWKSLVEPTHMFLTIASMTSQIRAEPRETVSFGTYHW